MCIITKRDGRREEFNKFKIVNAINKAFIQVDGSLDEYSAEKGEKIADYIYQESLNKELSIEQIQDLVENGLMSTKRKDVARAYIIYRNDRNREREKKSKLMKIVDEKLYATNDQKQNANVDEKSFGGRKGEVDSAIMKEYALNHIMSSKSKFNHLNNRIYIHDLDSYPLGMHNCLSVPFDDLLAKGFKARQTDVRPANSVNTALQLVAVIFQIQSLQQFGGVSATHLDDTLVPYIRKSFFKHYMVAWLKHQKEFMELDLIEMLSDDYIDEVGIVRNKFDDYLEENKKNFLKSVGLKYSDFKLSNKKKLNPEFYQSALYDTIIEVKQATEGMYHNLNTLQSRSGCEGCLAA